jgi:hypothetical protein
MKPGEQSEFNKIKTRSATLKTNASALETMQEEIEDMYWLEDVDAGGKSGRDTSDIKLTYDPSPQNKVDGVVRLISTSEPIVRVTNAGDAGDMLEKKFKNMINASQKLKLGRLEIDLVRSAVLYGECHMLIKNVADLQNIKGLSDIQLARLERLATKTSHIFEAVSPRGGYPVYGDYGLDAYYRYYETTVSEYKSRWGETAIGSIGSKKDEDKIIVNDWWDLKMRSVWVEGQSEPTIFAEHGLIDIPVVIKLADGSELFDEIEHRRKPFLYGVWKSGLWKRKNLVLTAIMTSMFERGTGILLAVEGNENPITVNYHGAVRTIEVEKDTKINPIDDKAYDPQMAQMLGQLDQLITESTIFNQTLGQPIGGNAAFSTVALLSQSGRLPLTSSQDAVSETFQDALEIAARWIKRENPNPKFLDAADIPDDYDLEVKLEVKLPQDMVRAAQTAMQLRGFIPDEWLYQNLMQITDVNATKKNLISEQTTNALIATKIQQMVEQAKAAAQQQMQPQQQMPDPGQQQPVDPNQMTPEQMQQLQEMMQMQQQQGGDQSGQYPMPAGGMPPGQGGEMMPATEPMTPGGPEGMPPQMQQ